MSLDQYIIVRKIGEGVYSRVYLALDDQANPVALKVITPRHTQARLEMFDREFNLGQRAHQLNSGMIDYQRLFESIIPEQPYFPEEWIGQTCKVLVMAYLEGDVLEYYPENDETVTPDQCRDILVQLARIVQSLHQNRLVHGDINLGNIIINKTVVRDDSNRLGQIHLIDGGGMLDLDNFPKDYFLVTSPLFNLPYLSRRRSQDITTVESVDKVMISNDVYAMVICGLILINPVLLTSRLWQWSLYEGDVAVKRTFRNYDQQYQDHPLAKPLFNLLWTIYLECQTNLKTVLSVDTVLTRLIDLSEESNLD